MLLSELFDAKPRFSKVTNGTWLYNKESGNLVLIYYADYKIKSLSWLVSRDSDNSDGPAFWWTSVGVDKKYGQALSKEDMEMLGCASLENWTILDNEGAADILVSIPNINQV